MVVDVVGCSVMVFSDAIGDFVQGSAGDRDVCSESGCVEGVVGDGKIVLHEDVKVFENLFLWKGIEKPDKVIIDVGVMGGGILWVMSWKRFKKLLEFLESGGHGAKAHSFWPYCFDNGVDGDGRGFEKFADDGAVVVENCAAFHVSFLAFEENHACG